MNLPGAANPRGEPIGVGSGGVAPGNLLQQLIASQNLTPSEVMNALQDHGIISDNAVHPRNVADVDFPKIQAFLKTQPPAGNAFAADPTTGNP
jgi:hypothetical protein